MKKVLGIYWIALLCILAMVFAFGEDTEKPENGGEPETAESNFVETSESNTNILIPVSVTNVLEIPTNTILTDTQIQTIETDRKPIEKKKPKKKKVKIYQPKINLKEPISYLVILTNTNVVELTNTAVDISGVSTNIVVYSMTNYVEVRTNYEYQFNDVYPTLAKIKTVKEMVDAVTEDFYPAEYLVLTNEETSWQKRIRKKKNAGLIGDVDLLAYSEESFLEFLHRKIYRELKMDEDEIGHINLGFEEWETKVIAQGWVELTFGYGWAFTDTSYTTSINGITAGLNVNQRMRVNVVGKIGDRINLNVNLSSDNPDSEYEIAFKALQSDIGILKEWKIGNINLNIPQSSYYIRYNGVSKDSYGVMVGLEMGDFALQAVANLVKSQKGYKRFTGNRRSESLNIMDVHYVKRKYFLLPETPVDKGSLELYILTSATNIADHVIDSRYFRRMVEGRDFYLNYESGELTLQESIERDYDLAVYYTKGGLAPDTNGAPIGLDTNNRALIYLWRATANYSPYLHSGYYNLGYRNFDPTRGFALNVVYTADRSKLADVQFSPTDYFIDPQNGVIKFRSPRPFKDPFGRIYTNATDPNLSDSYYTMQVEFYNQVNSYSLDFDIIAGTEQVFVNGRLLSSGEYLLIHSIGELIFANPALINENDTIEVYYEYKPFWSGGQKLGIATRLDWKPSNLINLGGTFIYNIAQRDSTAPSIFATPDSMLLADLDGNINIAKLLNFPDDITWTLKGEVALSMLDKNTVNYAIIDDFESIGDIFSFSKNETRWILSTPLTNIQNITYTNRGKLLYKDYMNADNVLQSFSTTLSSNQIKDYTNKCGPYITYGGHLNTAMYPNIRQTSLIFDYDFRDGGDWVGATYSIAGPAGYDMSAYNSISIWAKLEGDEDGNSVYEGNGTNTVEIYLVVGSRNEDADGNGILDGETDRAQAGYPFHNYQNPSLVETRVGGGRQSGGDAVIQSEDLNRNGILDTVDEIVVFPASFGYTDTTNALVKQGDWTKIEINISSLSTEQVAILQHASSISLIIKRKDGLKGRLIVDTIDFKSVSWDKKRVDNVIANSASVIKGEPLSVLNNTNYSFNRFYDVQTKDTNGNERALTFEKLHGPRTVTEAKQYNEKALAIVYNLTNIPLNTNTIPMTGGQSASLIKQNSTAMDISRYNYLHFYLFIPDRDEDGTPYKDIGDSYDNENFVLVLRTSDKSYYKWSIPLAGVAKNTWHKVTIDIFDNLTLKLGGQTLVGYERAISVGLPNLKDINIIEMGVDTTDNVEPLNRGVVWVNEFYAYSDKTQIGTAYYVETGLEFKKPVWEIGTFEVIGPLNFKSRLENKSYGFVPVEGNSGENFNFNYNFSLAFRLMKHLNWTFSYNQSYQGTSTNTLDVPLYLQTDYGKYTFGYTIALVGIEMLPNVSHSFTEDFDSKLYRNLINQTNEDYVLHLYDEQYSSSANFDISLNWKIFEQFTLNPNINYADTFYLLDKSNFTNDLAKSYLTNSGVYGMKTKKKDLMAGLRFYLYNFQIYGGYGVGIERYQKINNEAGYRSELETLKNEGLANRYSERMKSVMQGFDFEDANFEKQNLDNFQFSFSGNRPLDFLSFSLIDKLERQAAGYAYDATNALSARSEVYTLLSELNLNLYPKFLIFDTFNFRFYRNVSMSYNSVLRDIELTNVLSSYGEIYYNHPLSYNGLFFGDWARSNSLVLIDDFSEGSYSSVVQFRDQFAVEMILFELDEFWRNFIPTHYRFYSILNTSRNQGSYLQNLENYLETSLPIRIGEPLRNLLQITNSETRFDDINIRFDFKNIHDYNYRQIRNTLTASLSHNIVLNSAMNLIYSYGLSGYFEERITNNELYERQYGLISYANELSPQTFISHSGSIILNWVILDFKELDLWLFKLNLRGSTLENRESFSISADNIDFDGVRFNRFIQKVYEITYDHTSTYKFTDNVTGSFTLRAVLNQFAEVVPLGNKVNTTYFNPGFGIQFTINAKLSF